MFFLQTLKLYFSGIMLHNNIFSNQTVPQHIILSYRSIVYKTVYRKYCYNCYKHGATTRDFKYNYYYYYIGTYNTLVLVSSTPSTVSNVWCAIDCLNRRAVQPKSIKLQRYYGSTYNNNMVSFKGDEIYGNNSPGHKH